MTARSAEPGAERVAGRYTLLDLLGSGGMGAVYRARDETSMATVALKQLSSTRSGSWRKKLEALFEREYHTLVRLKHPRIIEVYDYGLSEFGPYYTMELLDGSDLQRLAPLPHKEACRQLRDVASSLALIHAHRLVHRDLSPRNVRLTRDGRAKLIDFGALTAFGPANEVVGTPPCMAPEIVRLMPLDQRTDYFALGAVAYWALTGQHAYPARRIDELPGLWQRAPAPPSQLVPDIPAALDALVLSLLSLDPLGRPTSAAAIIDQLTALAGLPAEELDYAADSYLSSGRMVGREGESEWVQKRVLRALEGKGAEIVIEGGSGIGKTRLLHELGLAAQLRGAVLLKADAQAATGFFGVAAALAAQVLTACPEPARRTLGASRELLAHLSPALREQLEAAELAPLTPDAGERRARFQTALFEWFLALARERTLVLAVDNLQAIDEESGAFLAAFGSRARESQLVLLLTLRAGEPLVAKNAVQALRQRSGRLKLSSLSQNACEELVGSLFGDVANIGRVARLLYERSGGNPQLCIDLAHWLVKKKLAKYAGGTWVLPLEVAADELPSGLEQMLAAKLDVLSAGARELAAALSVHLKPVSIELCLSARSGNDVGALAALDELVAEHILIIDGSSYRFVQAGLREALLARMDPAERKRQHLRAAESMLANPSASLETRMDAGWHLLRAGEELRGAELLAGTCHAFLSAQSETESIDHLVQALRTAIDVYVRHGTSEHRIAPLLFALMPLGYFASDWRTIVEYGPRAVALGMKVTGLSLAWRLRRLFGRKLALKLGLAYASFRFARAQKRGLEYGLVQAIGALASIVPSTFGAHTSTLDGPGAKRLGRMLRPLGMFPADQFPSLMYAWGCYSELSALGLSYESRLSAEELTRRFHDPHVRAIVGEGHFKRLHGGLSFSQAIVGAYAATPRTLELAAELDGLGIRIWAMSADQLRTLYHAFRGEIDKVRHYRARVELFAVQGVSTWQAELIITAALLNADILTGDVIATRRTSEQLARRAEQIPSLRAAAALAHAAYLALRGSVAQAIDEYSAILPLFPLRGRVSWLAMRGYFAQALNANGEHARAKQVLEPALAALDPNDDAIVLSLESRRQLALAELGLGHHQLAAEQLDALLARYAALDNPLLRGLLHKARAEVALAASDAEKFDRHFQAMAAHFRATANPALIAQCERLWLAATRAGVVLRSVSWFEAAAQPTKDTTPATVRTLAELTAAPDRAEYALALILERAHARSGYLYLWQGTRWILAAASGAGEPPLGLETQLKQQCAHTRREPQLEADHETAFDARSNVRGRAAQRDDLDDARETVVERIGGSPLASAASERGSAPEHTVYIDSAPPPHPDAHQLVVLSLPRAGQRIVVGGLILDVSPHDPQRLSSEVLEAVAAALYEHCGSSTVESLP